MSASPGAPAPREGDVSGMRPPGRWSVDHWPDRDCPWRVLRHEDSCDVYVDDYEFLYEAEARAVCDALNGLPGSLGAPTPAMIDAAAQEVYQALYAWGWDRATIGEQQAQEHEAVKARCRTIAADALRAALTAPEGEP